MVSDRQQRVSIGLPVFNGEQYLRELLDSLLEQDFEDFELVISDNASTDATADICLRYAREDPRIRYSRADRNLGAAANYNRVFALANGEYFKWAAHDDRYEPTYLRRCVETLDRAPESVVLCYPSTVLIDGAGSVLRGHKDNLDLRAREPHRRLRQFVKHWGLCNVVYGLVRASALEKTQLIEKYVGSDVTLLAELALLGEFWEIPEPLFFRRIHAGCSRQGDLTDEEAALWFDPESEGLGMLSPGNRVFLEILGSIARGPLDVGEKLQCLAVCIWGWPSRRLRVRGGALKRALRGRYARDSTPSSRE
jgi:glycosyltransferase involved in cell wall biosynthesis